MNDTEKLFEAMKIIFENMKNNSDNSKYGRVTNKSNDTYTVEIEGVPYKIKSKFQFGINERVLVLSPSGSTTDKYLHPNMQTTDNSNVIVDAYTRAEMDSLLMSKVNTDGNKKLSTEDFTTTYKNKLDGIAENSNNYVHPPTHPSSMIIDSAEKRFVTDNEKVTWNSVVDKVDKVEGKQLTDANFTSVEKTKLSGIADNANNYSHPSSHSASMITGLSVVATTGSYSDLSGKPIIPQKTSDLTNDNGFLSSLPIHNHDDRYYLKSEIDLKLEDFSGGNSSVDDNYDKSTTWNNNETVFTTTWEQDGISYKSICSEISDTHIRTQRFKDNILTEQWDTIESATSLDTTYTKIS